MSESPESSERITNAIDAFARKIPTSKQLATDAEEFVAELQNSIEELWRAISEKEHNATELLETLLSAIEFMMENENIRTLSKIPPADNENRKHELLECLLDMEDVDVSFANLCEAFHDKIEKAEERTRNAAQEESIQDQCRALCTVQEDLLYVLEAPDSKLRAKLIAYVNGLGRRKDPVEMQILIASAK